MGQPPNQSEILQSVQLLRSEDAAARKQGILILSPMIADPRVQQVFEYLRENDPDPTVRQLAWQALQYTPSTAIPAAAPPDVLMRPPAPPPPDDHYSNRSMFLLKKSNARFVAKELRRAAGTKRGGRWLWRVVAVLLLVVGLLWGLVIPDWLQWYEFRENGVTAHQAWIFDLQERGDKYYALYRFSSDPSYDPFAEEIGESPVYSGEQQVSGEDFRRMDIDTFEPVVFLPDEPDQSYLRNHQNPEEARRDLITGAAGGLTILILLLVLFGRMRRRPRRRTVIKGQLISSTSHIDKDGDLNIKLRYRFRSPKGEMITGQISQIRNDLKQTLLPDEGTPVAVYYRSDTSHTLL